MLAALDEGVGRVLGKLREHKIEDNTLVVFHSDNGGPTPVNTAKNTPFRGTKGTVWEGGVRVPFLMQWKTGLPAGKVYDQPVIALDVLPTAVAAGGGKVAAEVEGVNLTPFVKGGSGAPHEALFWRFGLQRAVRKGDWKLVDTSSGWELYNLRSDPSEATNIASANPDRVKDLTATYDAWDARNIEPKWKVQRLQRRRTDGPKPRNQRRARQ
jgi:arylsulfatase A-like enzyme